MSTQGPKRRMDRLLVLLFFVDFTISIVLCLFVAKAINQQHDVLRAVCYNQQYLTDDIAPVCEDKE